MDGIRITENGKEVGVVPICIIDGKPLFGDGAYGVYDILECNSDYEDSESPYIEFERQACASFPQIEPHTVTIAGHTFTLTAVECSRFGEVLE